MKKAVFLSLLLIGLLLSVAGCRSESGSPNATATVTSGKRPNASVSGTVTYLERLALSPGARLEVQLRDTSYQDAAAPLIAEQVIENPGQVPIKFNVEYHRDDIEDRNTYSIQADIIEADGRLAFTNDTAYDVITRGNPRRVDMTLVMVQPPPGPGGEVVDPNAWVDAPYPVAGAEMLPPHEGDLLRIFFLQSNLENCSRGVHRKEWELDGNDIRVTLTNQVPPPAPWAAPCHDHLVELDEIIDLKGAFTAGESYSVVVNGQVTGTFSRPDEDFPHSFLAPSQVQEVELQVLESDPPRYNLLATYGIPAGSGCSHDNGYTLMRGDDGDIVISLTYHEVAQQEEPVICITDYPINEVTIPLESDFEAGKEYTVRINGKEELSFTAQ